jgi:hypothetical protein
LSISDLTLNIAGRLEAEQSCRVDALSDEVDDEWQQLLVFFFFTVESGVLGIETLDQVQDAIDCIGIDTFRLSDQLGDGE